MEPVYKGFKDLINFYTKYGYTYYYSYFYEIK